MKTKLIATRRGSIALRISGYPERKLVDAYTVELPGWPEVKASVHRGWDSTLDQPRVIGGWGVTEWFSGLTLSGGAYFSTRAEAVRIAVDKLNAAADRLGRDRILQQIESYKTLPADPEPVTSATDEDGRT